jgi:hypothetical protein
MKTYDLDLDTTPTIVFDALGRKRWKFASGKTLPYISGGSDGGTTTAVTDPPATGTQGGDGNGDGDPDDGSVDWKARHDALQAQARKWEDRAKSNKAAADKLAKYEAENATEQEKAVKAAKEEGFNEARTATGAKLVRAELRTQAAEAGLPLSAVDSIMEFLDVSKLLTEEGDADEDKVKAIITARKATTPGDKPAEKKKTTDLGQGARKEEKLSGADLGRSEAQRRFGDRARSASGGSSK